MGSILLDLAVITSASQRATGTLMGFAEFPLRGRLCDLFNFLALGHVALLRSLT